MRKYVHILTDSERVTDPDGQAFDSLADAVTEAAQCARELMAEELRQGRPLPLSWRVQVADSHGMVEATLSFWDVAMGSGAQKPTLSPQTGLDPDLIERARAVFFKARRTQKELNQGLRSLSENMRNLSKLARSIPLR